MMGYPVLMSLRLVLIYLRHFWPAVPAAGVAVALAWMLWGLGPWVVVLVPLAAGAMTFAMLALISAANGR
jgi:acyl-coenzyme A synthetase/AMP-(fatty) acid ligase